VGTARIRVCSSSSSSSSSSKNSSTVTVTVTVIVTVTVTVTINGYDDNITATILTSSASVTAGTTSGPGALGGT
jgi:ABC-type lipoprotein release transport system permease subunit